MLVSFVIGYTLFFILGLIQIPFLRYFLAKQHQMIYSLIVNLFHLLAFVSVVQIWRSLWIICEQYINIPDYQYLTLSLCYVGAYLILTCGLTSCTLNGPGGVKEGYMDDQPIFLFQFEYFTTLLKVKFNGFGREDFPHCLFVFRINQKYCRIVKSII